MHISCDGLLKEKIVNQEERSKKCGRDIQEQAIERRARQNTMRSFKRDSKSVCVRKGGNRRGYNEGEWGLYNSEREERISSPALRRSAR